MIGMRRLTVEAGEETLRIARGTHLGQAGDEDYRREMKKAEKALNGQ